MKKLLSFIGIALLLMGAYHIASAQEQNSQPPAQKAAAVNVGNKICPVTGEKIDEKTKATYEYQGKIYNFCCPMCIDEFKKDPEKYIKKVEEELKDGEKH